MQTRDKVEDLYNCREFSQRLECLYQAMQTQEKSFLLLLTNNFPEKKRRKKFLPVAKSCTRSLARVIRSCFPKGCFPKYGFFSLKMSALNETKIDTSSLQRFSKVQPTKEWVN